MRRKTMMPPTDLRLLRNPAYLPFQERDRDQERAARRYVRAERAKLRAALVRTVPLVIAAAAMVLVRRPS
jgi:hypothetical protein